MSNISGIYSPLPQSISDSDSEKELHMDSICSTNSVPNIENSKIFYHNDITKHLSGIPKTRCTRSKMSSLRKTAFIISIICCFLPIPIFLWVLPCDVETCPIKVTNWESQQDGVEMKGRINLIYDKFKKNYNLAMEYKGNINSSELLKNGVLSYYGHSGGVSWYFRQDSIPEMLDCSLIDVNKNGILDCLLLDMSGLKAVEALTGEIIWHAHSHEEKMVINKLQFPIKIPDFNGDDVEDLLCVYQKKFLLIICGKTGRALSENIIKECDNVKNLNLNDNNVSFSCKNNSNIIYLKVNINKLKKQFKNNSYKLVYEKYYPQTTNSSTYFLDDYKLKIKNVGKCPNCSSSITWFKKRKTLFTQNSNQSFVAFPATFKFNSPESKLSFSKGHNKGFIVKVWHWLNKINLQKEYQTMLSERYKRNLDPWNQTTGYIISENILLFTFNNTGFNIINASETNVTQLCFSNVGSIESNCQPDVLNQEYSLLISDLDRDGSQELISYSSTFILKDMFESSPWHLLSTIRVLRLESELPKLFNSNQNFGLLPNY